MGSPSVMDVTRDRIMPDDAGTNEMRRSHWVLLGVLGVVEIVSAVYLASLNPVQGYDENWYLINAHRFGGITTLPYAFHRPPMFPLLLACFGDCYRLVPALAHIGSAAVLFILCKRLTGPTCAMAGLVVFMACGQLREYNVLLLTEMPSILLLLLVIYCFVAARSFLMGVVVTLLVMTHWSMAVVPPVVALVYAVRQRWADCVRFAAGTAVAVIPFLVAFTMAYGDPLSPVRVNLSAQTGGPNDWLFYLREGIVPAVPLILGGVAAVGWALSTRVRPARRMEYEVCLLLLGVIAARIVLIHMIIPKGARFLVPLVPMLLILTVLMIRFWALRAPRLQWVAWAILLVAVLPGRQQLYYFHDLRNDRVHQIHELKNFIETPDPKEIIFTDLNDLAVMGHTGHPAVAVIADGSWHHALLSREACTRESIPIGALYLTWAPGQLDVLASSSTSRHGKLSLVRWQRGGEAGDVLSSAVSRAMCGE